MDWKPIRNRINPPAFLKDKEFWKQASLYQFIYSLCGLLLGLACVIGGIVLFLHGVAGSTSWTAKIIGTESKVTDAAPGAVLFIVGLFVVWITRFDVSVKDVEKPSIKNRKRKGAGQK